MDNSDQAPQARAIMRADLRIIKGKKVKELRSEGLLPVQLYGEGIESRALQVSLADFEKAYGETGEANLLDLQIGDTIRQVYIKNLHFSNGSQIPIHADFYYIASNQVDDIPYQIGSTGKKPVQRRQLLKLGFAGLSIMLLFSIGAGIYWKHVNHQKTSTITHSQKVLGIKSQNESAKQPVRLRVPAINLDANIQHVGVNASGEMDVPSNAVDVGWFHPGPSPGEKGSAVIAGHFDSENGQKGVFNNLDKLKTGDKLIVEDGDGKLTTFIVRGKRMYDPGYADEVFSKNGAAHLNLITCDGVWDDTQKSYSKRLVVFADVQ